MIEYRLYKMSGVDTVENMIMIKANNDYMAKMDAQRIMKQYGGYAYELYNSETGKYYNLYL